MCFECRPATNFKQPSGGWCNHYRKLETRNGSQGHKRGKEKRCR